MRLVIDASAALPAFTSPAGSGAFAGHDLVAPSLLWSEFTAELHAALRRGEIAATTAAAALDAIDAVVERVDTPGLQRRAWAIAERLGWGRTYDAEYVAVALDARLPLLTLDARLARGVGHLITIIGPADLGL
jgi:predicted nucleic acid-binding protein